ncbi:MAG: helix-turn-helix domain-containing protein [Bacteroidales bacterium]|nr:helix-turn-helix domain-containing protein [Bacteroidales bacterium]MCM1416933.1 helix-turn-helix domain-containing protein [bacterium]MCM1424626.1 helix-turn-helix domain-containing protein [bacterium]
MSSVYESIMAGLQEAVEDAKGIGEKLPSRTMTVTPVKIYRADEVKRIRLSFGMTQKIFAGYMGVSDKTVEAWESGTNAPSGAASRILTMMEMDKNLVKEFPFVTAVRN